jgi:hypothetical protein
VTYNFDPERWYEANRAALDARRNRGELDDDAWQEAVADLDRRYDEMLARLDGTYVIPPARPES